MATKHYTQLTLWSESEMEIKTVLSKVSETGRTLQAVHKLLKKIADQDPGRPKNAGVILEALRKMDLSSLSVDAFQQMVLDLEEWKQRYQHEVTEEEERESRKLGGILETAFKNQGIDCSQRGPDLAAGLMLVRWDRYKRKAIIFYGPEEETLGECNLVPEEIVKRTQNLRKGLGSRLSHSDFLSQLKKAYQKVAGMPGKRKGVPIARVLVEMCFQLQSKRFFSNPITEYFSAYSRADFSYDLFRCRHVAIKDGLHLKTATLAKTSRREEFLWVPSSESIDKGDRYSELHFEEE